jgi:hypothetical protein
MPDGRTLEAGNVPVRWAQEGRDAAGNPVPLGNTSVPDTRLPSLYKSIQGPGLHELPDVYKKDDDDIPCMTWEELTLIRADGELELGAPANLLAAIGYVNALRTSKSLPTVSGAYLATLTNGTNDAAEVRALLFEERRRELFAEGGRFALRGVGCEGLFGSQAPYLID